MYAPHVLAVIENADILGYSVVCSNAAVKATVKHTIAYYHGIGYLRVSHAVALHNLHFIRVNTTKYSFIEIASTLAAVVDFVGPGRARHDFLF